MQTPKFEGAKKLEIDFEGTDFGWIYLTLTIGENSYQTRFSEVYDPLPSFKRWLEAVSIGVQQCSFSFETEGEEIKFDFESITWERKLFTVSYDYRENDEFLLSDYVDRKQLVEAFYHGFLNFSESPRFNRYYWEKISYAEHLTEWLELDYQIVLTGLLQFCGEELDKWLDKVSPQLSRKFFSEAKKLEWANELKTQAENFEKTANREVRKMLKNAKPVIFRETNRFCVEIGEIVDDFDFEYDDISVREIIDYRRVPSDYDDWTLAKKKRHIEEYLGFNCSGFDGTKISDFRSQITIPSPN